MLPGHEDCHQEQIVECAEEMFPPPDTDGRLMPLLSHIRESGRVAYRAGAARQRILLRTDEAVERVGRALNREGWTCYEGSHEPGQYDTCDDCKRVCDDHARAAITALVGDGS